MQDYVELRRSAVALAKQLGHAAETVPQSYAVSELEQHYAGLVAELHKIEAAKKEAAEAKETPRPTGK